MRAYERLLNYVKVYTTSDESTGTVPSTKRQFDLAKLLVEEMKALGIENPHVDDKCYVYGWIPATKGYEEKPALGFIAHLDTAPDASGENVKPQVIENYDGEDVKLGNSGLSIKTELYPEMKKLKGRTLIVTDGTTLLGADDKSGIAEILTAAEEIIKKDLPHGKICIAFTPDEEIGGGAADLDLEKFGAKYAYTVDGGPENEITYECFNAVSAKFKIKGAAVHTGSAKGKMKNAVRMAVEIENMLPSGDIPELTEGREGFYHLCNINGTMESAEMSYIVRDHDSSKMEMRKEILKHIEKVMNEKYGEGSVELIIKEQYRNMIEKIAPCMHLVENVREVMHELGMETDEAPVRGGTDGAQLSFRGLPCPNLGTGGYAFHGPYEHITAEGMDIAVKVILGVIGKYAK